MKRIMLIVLTLVFAFGLAATVHAANEKFETKAGDTIYVCACGEGCKCGTLSTSEGTCSCGKNLAKTTVNKVEGDMVFYTVDGKELSAPLTGAYYCGCGKCACNTISQKPGNCSCGKKLIKAKKP
ncbi:MAG TPA: hypothetical protein VFF53_05560 [Geobacteraceae bacterium]|nr:hypothetical protein [Geobacteraceae bacterium]